MAEVFFNRLLAPRVILPLLLIAVVAIVLMTPLAGSEGSSHLTTQSASPGGARAFYEAAERLGWPVERRTEEFHEPLTSAALYAVLAPPIPLSSHEIHVLLEAVRDGAGLLYVIDTEDAFADSLGIRVRTLSIANVVETTGIPATMVLAGERCAGGLLNDDPYRGLALVSSIETRNETLRDTVTLMQISERDSLRTAVLGATLGRGKVVVVSHPAFLRNDALHFCNNKGGVIAIRLVEWLTDSAGQKIVFDEHHHGFGTHPSTMRVMRHALTRNAIGRMALQGIVAALVLLVAAGARPIAPRPRPRIERRSPLEHVGALSRAYEQIGATKRATQLLVRGLRRRRDPAIWRRGSDDEFLRTIAKRHPGVASDVDSVRNAGRRARTPADFIHVGQAIEHIERTLSGDHS